MELRLAKQAQNPEAGGYLLCQAMSSHFFPNFFTGWASHLVGATRTLKDVSKEKDTFEASNVARLTWATAMIDTLSVVLKIETINYIKL